MFVLQETCANERDKFLRFVNSSVPLTYAYSLTQRIEIPVAPNENDM